MHAMPPSGLISGYIEHSVVRKGLQWETGTGEIRRFSALGATLRSDPAVFCRFTGRSWRAPLPGSRGYRKLPEAGRRGYGSGWPGLCVRPRKLEVGGAAGRG